MIAYENLEVEGRVYTLKGKGTFVSKKNFIPKDRWKLQWDNLHNEYANEAKKLDIVKSEIPWEKGLISFKSISPNGELFDVDYFKKSFLNRISIEGHNLLNYGYAKGYKPLMEFLLNYMANKGIETKNKEIIITNGFTEGFELLVSAYTKPGDKILCENPTHNTALKIMKVNKVNPIGVKMNSDGIDLEILEKTLCENSIKFGYLIPSYHNPTGIVLKGKKRLDIYNIFKKYNVPIIEDGFNEELLYNSSHVSPIAALDKEGNVVVYIGSFSKILFPGIRVGWIIADKHVIETLESVKRCKNIHTSFIDQGILYEYLSSGAFERHIKKAKKFYREKYEFAVRMVKKYINPKFIWGEGGLHIYIGIQGITARELLNKCYENGVIFTPGDIFETDDGTCQYTLRLGLSRLTLEEIEKGLIIIGQCLKEIKRDL